MPFKDIITSIPVAVTVWELRGDHVHLIWANQRAIDNAEMDLTTLYGQRADTIPLGLIPCVPALSAGIAEVAHGRSFDTDSVSLRGRVYRTYMHMVRPGLVTAMFEDCTEEYLAFLRLNKKADDLKRSNDDLEHYAYVTSHDLHEPLRVIRNCVGVLQEDHKDLFTGEAGKYMGHIVEHAEKGRELIDALLKYSRVGRDATRTTVDANETAAWVQKMFQDIAEQRGVRLHIDDLPTVWADPVLLRQGLQNMVGNAIKFRSDDRLPEVRLMCQDLVDRWVFCVQDNGIGFDMRHAKDALLLFRRMHTLDKSGTGIGLAICKRIAEWHGGECWLESDPGVGTKAYLSISKEDVS